MNTFIIPQDFLTSLETNTILHTYFMALPPSHQREYLRWIEEAKKPETRTRRIHKAIDMIRAKQQEVASDE